MLYHSHNLRSMCQAAFGIFFCFIQPEKLFIVTKPFVILSVQKSVYSLKMPAILNSLEYFFFNSMFCKFFFVISISILWMWIKCNLLSCDLVADFKINFAFRRKSVISWNSSTKCRLVNISIPTRFFGRFSIFLYTFSLVSENAHSN